MVIGDVVVPEDPADVLTPLDAEYDRPSSVADQLVWLTEAGFHAYSPWAEGDLAVLVGELPEGPAYGLIQAWRGPIGVALRYGLVQLRAQ